ncbi:MAG: prepilin-type N-terminal cleavage/methylation domain-containing protein [Fretibacterium sp.]|nr:prepilin-type N-terminal cleavage/methylation domain-containing protein [Fretibacterium sp.]
MRRGETLVELLMTLFILGLILLPVFQGLWSGQTGVLRLRRRDDCLYAAQWWFNRLPKTNSLAGMPKAAPCGEPRFTWEVRQGSAGLREVVLTVSPARGTPLTLTRVW